MMVRSLRGVGGVHIHGGVGEVWANGAQAGLIYDWRLDGWQRDFHLEAERYRLEPDALQDGDRSVEVVLSVGKAGSLRARGTIWTDYLADGHSHRAIVIRGGDLQWRKGRAVPAEEVDGASHT